MDRVMRLVPLLSFLLSIASVTLSLCNGNLNVPCQENERQTLLTFKKDLDDSSNLLSSWGGEGDCCIWTGVACDNLTGRVRELHLAGYFDEETFQRHGLGGKVNPSLLNLKHLAYLDLSYNDFGGRQFPSFLGSLKGLRYLNLSNAGFNGTIPHQLGNLSSLRYLELSSNYDSKVENLKWLSGLSLLKHLDMSDVDLSNASHWLQVNTLPSLLVELHLSGCELYHIPSGIANLTSLKVLDLSGNYFNSTIPQVNTFPSLLVELDLSICELYHMPSGIANLTSLKVLDLSWNHFNSTIPTWLYSLNHLESLDLSGCKLYHMPSGIANLTSLKVLDLSFNYFNSTIPQWLYSLNHLESLDLFFSAFHGEISSSLGNLTALIDLELSDNQFEGEIPNSLGNLCKLTHVGLSWNNFRGRVSEIFESLSRCSFGQIDSLWLSDNNFSGHLSDQLVIFKNLRSLDLSNNSISGPIPVSLGNLSRLERLVIDHNSFEGVVSEAHFTNLTRLGIFYANENSLTLKTSPDWVPPFQLSILSLSSWCLDPPQLPAWLQSQNHLFALNMSNTGISGTIPDWLWNISSDGKWIESCIIVDLSRNELSGEVPNIASAHWPKQVQLESSIPEVEIILGSNQFNGSLPLVSSAVSALDLSNSSFLGTLSHIFCDSSDAPKNLRVLLLDNNLLTGEIPDCWLQWPNLTVVNLEDNNLTGKIPSSIGDLVSLQSLHLRNNNLSGELPVSLQNCRELFLLDLRGNKFVGSIPIWFGQSLVVLILRSNMFQGTIPEGLCSLTNLQILDLAHNNLSGTIPRCFQNLSSMATKFSSEGAPSTEFLVYEFNSSNAFQFSYIENAVFVAKGREVKYNTVLRLAKSLDLSRNMLSGEIPEELTNLISLQTLNLSDNLLTGRIPSKIGDMGALESFDLSVNQLSGEISPSISNLTFLNHLNLSYNNLSGQIPTSTQLQSFDWTSYAGNKLCGPPLEELCSTNEVMPPVGDEKHREGHLLEDGGFYLSLGLGFAFGFWVVLGSLLCNVPWSNAFSQFQNRIVKKFYAAIAERY